MDSPYKMFARPGYLLALLMIIVPLFDGVMSVWPLQLSEERWRFGAVGAISNLTLIPLLGFLIALFIAAALDHRRVRRILGWVCAILAVLLAAVVVVFILDFFQTRAMVRPQYKHPMTVATITSLFKQVLTVITLVLLSGVGLSGPKGAGRKAKSKEHAPPPSLIPLPGSAQSD
jgi:hypothetical protein